MSKFEPVVSAVTCIATLGATRYQTVFPIGAHEGAGSCASTVAEPVGTFSPNGRGSAFLAAPKPSCGGAAVPAPDQ